MAFAPKSLFRGVPATGAPQIVYTAPGGVSVIVKSVVLTNTTNTAAAVTGSIGGTVFLSGVLVPANGVLVVDSGELDVLAPTETITLGQTTATAVTARVSGVTF